MIRNGIRSGALLVCLLLSPHAASSLERSIELGKEQLWNDMQTLDGVTRVDGRWGFKDLALSYGEYVPDASTELLLHFDTDAPPEPANTYRFIDAGPRIQTRVFATGGGSAMFNGDKQGVRLEAPPGALFAPGAVWGDVTIEFWLYPATLSNGENVLSWTGAAKTEASGQPRLTAQTMRCFIRDRMLVWDFQNLFTLPSGQRMPVTACRHAQTDSPYVAPPSAEVQRDRRAVGIRDRRGTGGDCPCHRYGERDGIRRRAAAGARGSGPPCARRRAHRLSG